MRRVFGVLLIAGLLAPGFTAAAEADDFDILRGFQTVGPASFSRWSGFYFGGQVGYGNANADFSNATQPLLSYSLRELTLEQDAAPSQWPVLGRASNGAIGYGAFAGYNAQFQDLVLGLEGN